MLLRSAFLAVALLGVVPAFAQAPPGGPPPSVGVVKVAPRPIIQSNEFVGRVQATDRVQLVARVTGFLDQRLFAEGTEVKQGDLLYRLERGPFEADLQQKQASVAQATALLQNATITLGRAQTLLNTPAGQRSTVDDGTAQQRNYAAQLMSAQGALKQSQINLDYTEIHAPITGQIGRTTVTTGNVVSPSSGALATIVSQDPMYVTFPVSVRVATDLRNRYVGPGKAGFGAVVIRLRLPDGTMYGQTGQLNFVDNTIAQNTDTILLRGSMPNPLRAGAKPNDPGSRDLTDGEFVTVLLQSVEPIQALGIPRAAVLSDQQGDYVYVVSAQNQVQQRRIVLGQSTPATAVITSGLTDGENVVVDGIQRVRPGMTVSPGPASPPPAAAAAGAAPH